MLNYFQHLNERPTNKQKGAVPKVMSVALIESFDR